MATAAVFTAFLLNGLPVANAGKASYCCATSDSWNECKFETQKLGDHGCLDITYTNDADADDVNAASWTDFEFVASVEFTKAYAGSVTTTEGRSFSFSLKTPTAWEKWNWQFKGNDGKYFEADLRMHIVGLTMKDETPFFSVSGVLIDPQPVQEMSCDDGLIMTCGLDPMFSMLDYKVSGSGAELPSGATKPECISKGSWEESRNKFIINMDVCGSTVSNRAENNASHLTRTVVLEPEDETWYLNQGTHASIPNNVVCTCVYEAQGHKVVVLDDNWTKAEILYQQDEGRILNMTAQHKFDKYFVHVTLKLATNLSFVDIEKCSADAIGFNGKRKYQDFPLIHNYKAADAWDRSQLKLGFTEDEYKLLQRIEVKTEKGYRHQVVEFLGFTAGGKSIRYECSAWVCLEDGDDLTDDSAIAAAAGAKPGVQRCLKQRRLSASAEFLSPARSMSESRRLDTPEEAQSKRVALSDSECVGFPMPGVTGCPENGTFASIEFKFDALDYNKLTPTVKENLEKTLKDQFASTSGVDQDLIYVELSAGSIKVEVTIAGAKPDVPIPTVAKLTDAVKLVPDINAVIADGQDLDDIIASNPRVIDPAAKVEQGSSVKGDENETNMAVHSHFATVTVVLMIFLHMM